jgi:hypothetical protein
LIEQPAGTPPSPSAEPPPLPPPAMTDTGKRGSGLRLVIIAIILVALIVIAIIGYAVAGYAAGESRVSNANKTLNAVISDQNKLTTTFKEIDTRFKGLSTGSNFDAQQAKTLLGQFIADAQDSTKTVVQDQGSLAAASTRLDEQQWLTAIDKGHLDKAHARINHALKALANAKIVSEDYVQDGQFLQSFMDVILDLDKLGATASASDLAGAKAVIATLKTHVDTATQLSTAPGLPTQMHALMVDFQTLTADFGKLIDAAIAGDETGVTTYSDRLHADVTKLGTYNFDQMGTDVTAYYQPYIDTFNSEMSAATA